MLGARETVRRALLLVALLLAADILFSLFATCDQISHYPRQNYTPEKYCTALAGPLIGSVWRIFVWVGHILHEYDKEIVALFTAILTISTVALWWSTRKLWVAGENQFKLAREEFIATHRPKIKIHAVEITRREVSETDIRIGASILCFNIGESAAKNVEVRGQIFMGPSFAIDVQRPIVRTFPEVSSGQKLRAEMNSDWQVVHAAAGRRTGIFCYCIGWIAYCDDNGYRRETGFCLQAEFSNSDGDRWVSAGKPEYEYEY
jgi:hypothetical protein